LAKELSIGSTLQQKSEIGVAKLCLGWFFATKLSGGQALAMNTPSQVQSKITVANRVIFHNFCKK
jgi:hypothetical protein